MTDIQSTAALLWACTGLLIVLTSYAVAMRMDRLSLCAIAASAALSTLMAIGSLWIAA